jgi:hypothetical protein
MNTCARFCVSLFIFVKRTFLYPRIAAGFDTAWQLHLISRFVKNIFLARNLTN